MDEIIHTANKRTWKLLNIMNIKTKPQQYILAYISENKSLLYIFLNIYKDHHNLEEAAPSMSLVPN